MDLTHIDKNGNAVMVGVGEKADTNRRAVAEGNIYMSRSCYQSCKEGQNKKGDVLTVAQVAGIMAVKKTSELIPLCHSLPILDCKVSFLMNDDKYSVTATCSASCIGKTGVEMEALTGVSVALLTIYDMCKAIDKGMRIEGIRLLEKEGGRSGHYIAE